jgi:hypothetical protein
VLPSVSLISRQTHAQDELDRLGWVRPDARFAQRKAGVGMLAPQACVGRPERASGQARRRRPLPQEAAARRSIGLIRAHRSVARRHPVVGPITVHYEASALGDEDQLLYGYSVEPGTPSADAMALLGSWAATEDRGSSDDHARQKA